MTLNPEFRRNLWLELSLSRFLGLAAVLVLTVAGLEAGGRFGDIAPGYVYAGKLGFFLTVILWGTRRVAAGMGAEVRSATWDWQRLSAMGPWSMTWGKLFGPTAFTWLAGGFFLILIAVGRLRGAEVMGPEGMSGLQWGLASEIAMLLLDGVLAQAVTLLTALVMLRKQRGARQIPVALLLGDLGPGGRVIGWYNISFDAVPFILASKIFFTGAAVIACLRLMREELQLTNIPWGWAFFLALLGGYLYGFVVSSCAACGEVLSLPLALFFAVFALGAYAALFADRKDPLDMAGFLRALRSNPFSAYPKAPLWLPSFKLALLFGIASAVLGASVGIGPETHWAWAAWQFDSYTRPLAFSLIALMLRDFALVLGMAYGNGGAAGRSDLMAVFWLALLYFLLPATLQAMGMNALAGIFAPPLSVEPSQALLGAGGQAVAAVVWAVWRWRSQRARFAASLPDGVSI
ncbi:MAG: hypothetical protein P8X52_10595 [Limibacillus sp.]